MKIWISKNSDTPVREQVVAQIILGITSGDLALGEKLPSTQEIARRFELHSNTVSNAYQKLAEGGWVEYRKGSGFFVCETPNRNSEMTDELDLLILEFLEKSHSKGYSNPQIRAKLSKYLNTDPPESILLIESDERFREILLAEIIGVTNARIETATLESFDIESINSNVLLVAMSDEKPNLQSLLGPDDGILFLNSRSVADSMDGQKRPAAEDLIAVASGWDKFLVWAKTMLVAANVDPETLVIRSTGDANWRNGLDQASMIICDTVTSEKFLNKTNIRVFPLISADSIQTLRNILQR